MKHDDDKKLLIEFIENSQTDDIFDSFMVLAKGINMWQRLYNETATELENITLNTRLKVKIVSPIEISLNTFKKYTQD